MLRNHDKMKSIRSLDPVLLPPNVIQDHVASKRLADVPMPPWSEERRIAPALNIFLNDIAQRH